MLTLAGLLLGKGKFRIPPQEDVNTHILNQELLYKFIWAEKELDSGNYKKALELYQYIDNLDPLNLTIKEKIMTVLYQLSSDDNNRENAWEQGLDFIESGLYSEKVLLVMSDISKKREDYESSQILLEKLVEMNPSEVIYKYYLLNTKLELKKRDDSLFQFLMRHYSDRYFFCLNLYKKYKEVDFVFAFKTLFDTFWETKNKEYFLTLMESSEENDQWKMLLNLFPKESLSVDYRYIRYLIEELFENEKYKLITENEDLFKPYEFPSIIAHRFLANLNVGDYNEAKKIKEKAISDSVLSKKKFHERAVAYSIAKNNSNNYNITYDLLNNCNDMQLTYDALNWISSKMPVDSLPQSLNFSNYNKDQLKAFKINANIYSDSLKNLNLLKKIDPLNINNNYILKSLGFRAVVDFEKDSLALSFLQNRSEKDYLDFEILGNLYLINKKDTTKAIHYFTKQMEIKDPINKNFYINYGSLILLNPISPKKFSIFTDSALESFPEDSSIFNLLAYYVAVHEIEDRYQEAEKWLTKALQLKPNQYHYMDSMAWLYYKMGRFDDALNLLEKIPDKDSQSTEIAYHKAVLYEHFDNYDKAISYYELAVELDNNSSSKKLSKQRLQKLRRDKK